MINADEPTPTYMLFDSITMPVELPEVYQGFAEAKGLVRSTPSGLVLEYEVKDAMFGLIKSDVKHLQIPLEELAEVNLTKGWFRTHMTLRTKRLQTLADLPGSSQAQITLKLARKDRSLAEQLVSFLNLRICEHDLQKMSDGLSSTLCAVKASATDRIDGR